MPLTIPNTFTTATVAEAGEVNGNFTAVKTFVDALATGVNIDSLAITEAKLAAGAVTSTKIGTDAVSGEGAQVVLASQVFG